MLIRFFLNVGITVGGGGGAIKYFHSIMGGGHKYFGKVQGGGS